MNAAGPPGDPHVRHRRWLAGLSLATAGLLDVLVGVAQIPVDPYVDAGASGIYHLDITGWGWAHVAVGVAALVTGSAALTDRAWTIIPAIAAAAGGIGLNLLLLPYHPLAAVLTLALDVLAARLLSQRLRALPRPAGRR